MNKAEIANHHLNEMDVLANKDTPIHQLSALSKLIVTIVYILFVMSFPKYSFSFVLSMALYPYLLFLISGHSFFTCIKKIRFILPLIIFVGIFNPILDKREYLGFLTYGWMAFFVLLLKGFLAICASYLLISTTKIDDLCAAMRSLHIPEILVTNILLTYRYISLLIQEVSIMLDAYHLRAPNQKGIVYQAWGSFVGNLLLRTSDRAKEIYDAMELRGYNGEFYYAKKTKITKNDIFYIVGMITFFYIARKYPLFIIIGNTFVR